MSVSRMIHRDPSGLHRLRLYTHNIWKTNGQWHDRRRVLIDGIRELRPDIVTLQETLLTQDYDQAVDILGTDYAVVHASERGPDGVGISTASRWPITEVHELDLNVTDRTGDFSCTALVTEIAVPTPFGRLLVVNHLPDGQVDHERERELQTVLVARQVEEWVADQPAHVLLAGDLDAEPDAACLRFLAGKQSLEGMSVCYRSAWDSAHPGEPGHTFTLQQNPLVRETSADWPFHRIDHIFVRCQGFEGPSLEISACELAFDQPIDGVWASDHFGLIADFASLIEQ